MIYLQRIQSNVNKSRLKSSYQQPSAYNLCFCLHYARQLPFYTHQFTLSHLNENPINLTEPPPYLHGYMPTTASANLSHYLKHNSQYHHISTTVTCPSFPVCVMSFSLFLTSNLLSFSTIVRLLKKTKQKQQMNGVEGLVSDFLFIQSHSCTDSISMELLSGSTV
ncbi:unnamed protein product [Lactuca saligna]|uniref:Uncharacterized protein n=1 Tax=Lactuca saligna TaxID=75948 RepID=A0AA36DWT9_LACSI|nr:unnamed protein product [Lactuca saligna]